jgi:hypothetical protein
LPISRAHVALPLRIYTSPQVPLPDGTFLAVSKPQSAQPSAKLSESRPQPQEDPAISSALKIIAEPVEAGQSRRLAAKGHASTTRHLAHKSRRHERNDAYARANGSWRNSYGYAANRNSNWFY